MTIRKKKFGWANIEIPVLGQGTWMIEGDQLQERKAIEALRLGIDSVSYTHLTLPTSDLV